MREHINEKFTEESDPIKDLGIGKRALIKRWLKKHGVTNYIIKSNFEIDVNEDVDLTNMNLENFPNYIQFNKVIGMFNIGYNKFTTLRGCPRSTGSWFSCVNNKLTTLDYAPMNIGITLFCRNNLITKKALYKYALNSKQKSRVVIKSSFRFQLDTEDYRLKHKEKINKKKLINEKFIEESDPIEDLELGSLPVIQKQFNLMKKEIHLLAGEIMIVNGKKLDIKKFFNYEKIHKVEDYDYIVSILQLINFDKYLVFPGKIRTYYFLRNRILAPTHFIWNIKPEYKDIFKKIK